MIVKCSGTIKALEYGPHMADVKTHSDTTTGISSPGCSLLGEGTSGKVHTCNIYNGFILPTFYHAKIFKSIPNEPRSTRSSAHKQITCAEINT